MIAEHGYDALSTRALAKAAGVTQPTLYNLIGSKEAIVKALLLETAERIASHAYAVDQDDLIGWLDALIGRVAAIAREDETYYRAAVIAGDRDADLFAEPDGAEDLDALHLVGARAIAVYRAICGAQIERGRLRGTVGAAELAAALWGAFRVTLRDWAYGLITLEVFERKLRSSHRLILAADAAPALRRRLLAAPPDAKE